MPEPHDPEDYEALEAAMQELARRNGEPRTSIYPPPAEPMPAPVPETDDDRLHTESVWDDTEPPNMLRDYYQGVVDDMSPSMAPQNSDLSLTPSPDDPNYQTGSMYDLDARNMDDWRIVPHEGYLAGERIRVPEGYGKDEMDSFAYDATYGNLGGRLAGNMQHHKQKPSEVVVSVGKPEVQKLPEYDVDVGMPVIHSQAQQPDDAVAPEEPAYDPRRPRR